MNTELTIGAINPGYGGLPIGVAAALGGATHAWHAHPGQAPNCPGRAVMRYHHPHAGAHTVIDAIPPMVDVLTINGYDDWTITGTSLIGAGYKPPLVIVETESRRSAAVPICGYLRSRGYRAAWQTTRASDVGAPHRRPRVFVIAVRKDCDVPAVNAAYLDADRSHGPMWPTPSAYDTHLDVDAYRWARADMDDRADSRALEHWEKVTGERYPYPVYTPAAHDALTRISMEFVEWMMGLPIGYVGHPAIDLDRDERMNLLYSGTVPLQAAHAVASGMSRVYQL